MGGRNKFKAGLKLDSVVSISLLEVAHVQNLY